MLSGTFYHQLDGKNRIRIPARLKKELGDVYYFAKGTQECIFVFPQATVDAQVEKLKEIKLADEERQKSLRSFSKSFVESDEDNQGRVVLNGELRKHAKINKELVIIGAITRVEIWAREVYDEYFADEDDNYDSMIKLLDI
jgi:MraZ protein